jgi:hypothetical protein
MNCGTVLAKGGKCDAFKGCFKCPDKWSLISKGDSKYKGRMTCKDCSKVDAEAVACTATKVLACGNKFALSEDGSKCEKIDDSGKKDVDVTNCQVAQIYTDKAQANKKVYKCNVCNPKYYADANGNCAKCPKGCLFCKADKKCSLCEPGTYFDTDKCVRCSVANCRICAGKSKCQVCAPGMFADKDGSCKRCHGSCGECIDGTKTGCLTCRGEAVFTTAQKAMNASYEDANKMFDMIDKPPMGKDLLAMNMDMVKAMKSAKARRVLAKEKVSASEKTDFDNMEKAGKVESDKKTTDVTDDKMINEIWNSGGRLEKKDETDAKARENMEKSKKKVRKMSVCAFHLAQPTKKVWDSTSTRSLRSATSVSLTVRSAECTKVSAQPVLSVSTKSNLLLRLRSLMMMETSRLSKPRNVRNVTLPVRDVPVQRPLSARVATRASSLKTVPALPVLDVSPVKSKWTLPIPSASRMTEPDAKSARSAPTPTATDVRMTNPEAACSARKVTPEPRPVPVSSVRRVALSARTPILV